MVAGPSLHRSIQSPFGRRRRPGRHTAAQTGPRQAQTTARRCQARRTGQQRFVAFAEPGAGCAVSSAESAQGGAAGFTRLSYAYTDPSNRIVQYREGGDSANCPANASAPRPAAVRSEFASRTARGRLHASAVDRRGQEAEPACACPTSARPACALGTIGWAAEASGSRRCRNTLGSEASSCSPGAAARCCQADAVSANVTAGASTFSSDSAVARDPIGRTDPSAESDASIMARLARHGLSPEPQPVARLVRTVDGDRAVAQPAARRGDRSACLDRRLGRVRRIAGKRHRRRYPRLAYALDGLSAGVRGSQAARRDGWRRCGDEPEADVDVGADLHGGSAGCVDDAKPSRRN